MGVARVINYIQMDCCCGYNMECGVDMNRHQAVHDIGFYQNMYHSTIQIELCITFARTSSYRDKDGTLTDHQSANIPKRFRNLVFLELPQLKEIWYKRCQILHPLHIKLMKI